MAYADLEDIRLLTNIEKDEVTDGELSTIRDRAEQKIIKDITIERENEEMEPNLDGEYIDGDNKIFYTKESPIADVNRTGSVNTDDLIIKVWDNISDGEVEVHEVRIGSLDPQRGKVTLTRPPDITKDKVTATYSFYNSESLPDWDLLETASVYLSGYMSVVKTRGKVPSKYSIGDLSVDDDLPGRQFLREYRTVLNRLRKDIS